MHVVAHEEGGQLIVTGSNALFLATLGYESEELIGRPLLGLYAPASRAAIFAGGATASI
jgi:hypothetical protein